MEFKSGTKMRENYISELQRQNLILILKCCRGRKKTGTYYFTPSTYYTLLLLASISMDVQWSGNRNYVSEPGTNTIGSPETGGSCAQKHQKKNASSQCTVFLSSRMPTARMKRTVWEQGRLWTQCLLHRTLLLKPWTSPTPAPSVFSLPSSAGPRLSRLGQSWAGRNHVIYFQSLKKTPTCHHRQWAAGAADFGARQYSKWLAGPRHITLNQDSMCSLSLPSSGFTPLPCSQSPYPRTHLHSHILSYPWTHPHGHATHTLIFTCLCTHSHAYTHSFTHTYMHAHTWPHNSSFHGALALWEAWWVLVLRKSIFI